MQKKLIALAVAGLVSGAAFAQSNVTVSGTVDMGVTSNSSHTTDGIGRRNSVDDGGWDSSRIRFEGVEDLGNGLAISFRQEYGTRLDRGVGSLSARKSWLALDSKTWGSVKAGSFGNVHDDINGFSEVGGMGYGNSVLGMLTGETTYNALQYVSPLFSGLQFKLGLSSNDINADDVDDDSVANVRAYSGVVSYVNGPLKAGLSYDRKKLDDATLKEMLLSVGYDFGVVMVGAGYDRSKSEDGYIGNLHGAGIGTDWTKKAWRLNLGVPFGQSNVVALSYSRVKFDYSSATDLKASGIGLAFVHKMSKRTNVYATYGSVSQDEDTAAYAGYEKLFKVGIRHQF